MALNYGNIRSLASLVNMFSGTDPVKAQLVPLDDEGRPIDALQRAFQYFPENINDSKGANYATRNIPGGSHPLYQYINGTDRTISFTAIFTSDEDPAPPELSEALQGGLDANFSSIGKLIGGGAISNSLSKLNSKKHVTTVDSAIVWLRSFLYPRYTQDLDGRGRKLNTVAPPRVVTLYLPNSGIHGVTTGEESSQLIVDSINCIMMQCDVVYEAFYRNGTQRITTVNLSFNETVQTGAQKWGFADGSAFTRAWSKGLRAMSPYNIKDTSQRLDKVSIQTSISSSVNKLGSRVGV